MDMLLANADRIDFTEDPNEQSQRQPILALTVPMQSKVAGASGSVT